jgi:hypothetical protein
LADAHRRVAEREHRVEERMKHVAPETSNPESTREAADEISARADEHLETAEHLDARNS